jgi:hypothetical protein
MVSWLKESYLCEVHSFTLLNVDLKPMQGHRLSGHLDKHRLEYRRQDVDMNMVIGCEQLVTIGRNGQSR